MQLRQDQAEFTRRNVEVLVIGPDNQKAFQRFWGENDIPYIGMADCCSKIASKYHQEVNIFKLGRMPALFVVDAKGLVRYHYYSDDMADIITNREVLDVIDGILAEG